MVINAKENSLLQHSRLLLWILSSLFLVSGCVERRIKIISDPPGAKVLLDGVAQGQTPIKIPFTFYGTREIVLYRDGYQVFARMETISPPVYQFFPIDFFSELLFPFYLTDEHRFSYTLKPHFPADLSKKQQLLERAQNFSQEVTKDQAIAGKE